MASWGGASVVPAWGVGVGRVGLDARSPCYARVGYRRTVLFGWSCSAGLESERDLGDQTGVAHRACRGSLPGAAVTNVSGPDAGLLLEGGQRPAPSGELTGDRGVGDRWFLRPG